MTHSNQCETQRNTALLTYLANRVPSTSGFILKVLLISAIFAAIGRYLQDNGMDFEAVLSVAVNLSLIFYVYFNTFSQAADQDWCKTLESLPNGVYAGTERFIVAQVVEGRGQPNAVQAGYNALVDFYSMYEKASRMRATRAGSLAQ